MDSSRAPDVSRDGCRRIVRDLLGEDGASASRPAFGERAVAKGLLTPAQLEKCLAEQAEIRRQGRDVLLGQVMLQHGFLSVDELIAVLERPISPEDRARQIGKYRLDREVGRGGMGIVYEAEDTDLRRRVALKILLDREATPPQIKRLHREAAIAAQLKHPGIVSIHEVSMVQDALGRPVHFIAMEFVEGTTLAALLEKREKPLADLARVLADVAHAVGHAHKQGAIHRDLKPSNVIVEPGGRAVLTDFGLARMEGLGTKLTHSLDVVGTPQYMAPEQIAGKTQSVDARADVYAIGVILYEILTGRAPFRATTAAKLFEQILRDEPRRPGLVTAGVPPDLEIVCLKALEKDPKRRYVDGEEIASELERFLRGEPIQARPPGIGYRMRKWIRRRRVALALGASLLAMGIGALFLSTTLSKSSEIRKHFARAEEHERNDRLLEARGEYRSLLQAHPAHEPARSGLTRVEGKIADRKTRALEQAKAAESNQRFEEALEALHEAWRLDPEDGAIGAAIERVKSLSEEQHRKAEREAAETYCIDAMHRIDVVYTMVCERRRPPTDAEIQELVSIRESCLGKMEEVGDFEKGCHAVARSYELIGDLDHAYRAYDRGFKGDVGWPLVLDAATLLYEHALTMLLVGVGDDLPTLITFHAERAERILKAAAPQFPDFVQLRRDVLRGISLVIDGVDAAPYCQEMFAKWQSPGDQAGFYVVRGLSSRNHDRLIDDMTTALRLSPDFYWALFWRATGYLHANEFSRAIADLTSAVAANPWFVLGYCQRGLVHELMGSLGPAFEDYSSALRINPEETFALVHRAQVRAKAGDKSGAVQDAEAALRLDLPPTRQEEMQELLRALEKTP